MARLTHVRTRLTPPKGEKFAETAGVDPNPDGLPDELTTTHSCSTCGGAWGTVLARFGNEAAAIECLYGHVEYIECAAEYTDGFSVTHRPLPGFGVVGPLWDVDAEDAPGLIRWDSATPAILRLARAILLPPRRSMPAKRRVSPRKKGARS